MKTVLFYSDAAEFGGHEAMTLKAIRCICGKGISVAVIFYEGNTRFQAALSTLTALHCNLKLVPTTIKSGALQAFRSLISVRKVRNLSRLMRRMDPDVVVVSQGRIEAGTLGLLAAKHAGLRCISYIPMAHSLHVSGKSSAIRLRELLNGYFYRRPDEFITISRGSLEMLLARGVNRKISVVPNAISPPTPHRSDRVEFREQLGIRSHEYLAGLLGRIEFRQKAQDFLIETITRFRDQLQGFRFVFAGEGPDQGRLQSMIGARELDPIVQLLPWSESPARIYAGIDLLLIPSKFEGVPLVMLEAMSLGLPIVASAVDGMAELLPPRWLFPVGNHEAFAKRMLEVRSGDNSHILRENRIRIADEFHETKFCAGMNAAILGLPADSEQLASPTAQRTYPDR